jgi:hypothetical protein
MKFGLKWVRNNPEYFWNQFWNPSPHSVDLKTKCWNLAISCWTKISVLVHISYFGSLITNVISQRLFVWTRRTTLVFGQILSDTIKRYQNDENGVGSLPFLRSLQKQINSLGVSSEKVTFCGKPPHELLFLKNGVPWNSGTCQS